MNGDNPLLTAIGLTISSYFRFDVLSLSSESIKNDLDISALQFHLNHRMKNKSVYSSFCDVNKNCLTLRFVFVFIFIISFRRLRCVRFKRHSKSERFALIACRNEMKLMLKSCCVHFIYAFRFIVRL